MLSPLLLVREKYVMYLLSLLWLITSILFCIWWFDISHIGTVSGFIVTSLIIIWAQFLSFSCLFFLGKMKSPRPIVVPIGKTAVVVTKAPSEPFELLKRTLNAVLQMEGVFDTWVADEDPTIEALEWYEKHNIKVSCRKNDASYHNDKWPRRKKCKEGNLAYFYDTYGYEMYDYVVQMDIDHVPSKYYLKHMVLPFSDPKVGYVCAPSMCDLNASTSWSSRARMISESMFHGPLQAGANSEWAPLCIGSHYAVRTETLKKIGGLGPELAEDYSTTLMMNAAGWKGVWAGDAEAHGDGPITMQDLIIQDYQWARSLVMLFFTLYPRLFMKLTFKKQVKFTFTQLWYPITAILWLAALLIPSIALLTGITPVKVDFIEFMTFISIQTLVMYTVFYFIKTKGHLRPKNIKFLSWENTLFELARWPWVFIACIDALISVVSRKNIIFKVTPKGANELNVLPFRLHTPYIFIVFISMVAITYRQDEGQLLGYYWFSVITTFSYIFLIIFSVFLHVKESPSPSIRYFFKHKAHLSVSFILILWCIVEFPSKLINSFPYQMSVEPIKQEVVLISSSDTTNEEITLQTKTPTVYTINYGDYLWEIAEEYYGDGTKWDLLQTNGSTIINPGDTIIIN